MLRTEFDGRSPLETTILHVLGVLFVVLSLATFAVGCGDDSPGEQVGEAVEEAGDDVEDALDD